MSLMSHRRRSKKISVISRVRSGSMTRIFRLSRRTERQFRISREKARTIFSHDSKRTASRWTVFIGSHLAERLVELGAQTRALVHYRSNGSWGWLDSSPRKTDIEIIAGDVCDRDCVLKAMRNTDVVFHLAALIGIPYSYDAPASY